MKILISVCALSAMMFTSCVKKYDCECRTVYSNGTVYKTWTQKSDMMTKNEAESWCRKQQVLGGGTVEVYCNLK